MIRSDEGLGDDRPGDAGGTPWERREWEGAARGLVATVWMLISRPRQAFRRVRGAGPWSDRVLFAIAIGLAASFLDSLADLVAALVAGSAGSEVLADLPFGLEVGDRSLTWIPAGGLGLAGCLVAVVVGVPVGTIAIVLLLFLASGVLHGSAWLTGVLSASPARERGAGYRATVAVVAFATVGLLASALPWVGDLAAMVWSTALAVIGLAELHASTPRRSLAAALLPWLPFLALILVFLVIGR